jgi:hypothetical protein
MADGLLCVKDFLQERHLTRRNNGVPSAQTRERLERSHLLEMMRGFCAAINTEAGAVIVEEHYYLPPEPVVSSFAFTKGLTEYVMRVELWSASPSLVFVTRRWRDTSLSRFFRWVNWFVDLEPLSVSVKCTCTLEEEDVSEEEIKRCFFYLLSGFGSSYIPSFRACNNSSKDSWRG